MTVHLQDFAAKQVLIVNFVLYECRLAELFRRLRSFRSLVKVGTTKIRKVSLRLLLGLKADSTQSAEETPTPPGHVSERVPAGTGKKDLP
ncbi:hypothetical protein AK812_SmicGene16788 [Symbiodinium microadriaticum]|uniref:Uncharacterized protein n=1 Tax=Symbiodinium microadriaticum TaxID=2951 RepID=A0A1Q9DZH8_SYMMI|nr:hypothetical protein AK812_SmicGene16788 [Symbiodinium microadriaticum]